MEFIVCMFLATILTGTRPIADMIQSLKGVEPPHLTKARLKAEQQAQKAAAAQAKAESRPVRPGEDKPTLGDLFRVYRGDAIADAIDLHNRHREQKQRDRDNPPEQTPEPRLPLWKQIRDLLTHPVGDPKSDPTPGDTTEPPTTAPQTEPAEEPLWTCLGCDLLFTGPAPDTQRCRACINEAAAHTVLPAATRPRPTLQPPSDTQPSLEGDDMAQPVSTTGTATGDAHDLESAGHQCDLLGDDLTRIDTALDVIDEAITSAGTATELVEAFLTSKNADETTVGGMSSARDMLSPERIKTLIDAITAAKAGVQASKEAIDTMNEKATDALQGADGSIVNGR